MPSVLVVDDSSVERRLIGGLLQKDENLDVRFAENGVAALEAMARDEPDLVISDLQMPEMDGLALVREIKVHHSHVPVILMTAHGSESIAIDALREGASSYVPKDNLAESLSNCVAQILSIAAADRTSEELMNCLGECEFTFELDNDPDLIDPLVRYVQQQIQGIGGSTGGERIQLAVALEQAMLNAIYRGNLEITSEQIEAAREDQLRGIANDPVHRRRSEAPYRDRRVYVDVALSQNEARMVVRDEGPGFDATQADPEQLQGEMQKEQGRGIVLMRTFMDEVIYNDAGNEVTLIKRRAANR